MCCFCAPKFAKTVVLQMLLAGLHFPKSIKELNLTHFFNSFFCGGGGGGGVVGGKQSVLNNRDREGANKVYNGQWECRKSEKVVKYALTRSLQNSEGARWRTRVPFYGPFHSCCRTYLQNHPETAWNVEILKRTVQTNSVREFSTALRESLPKLS